MKLDLKPEVFDINKGFRAIFGLWNGRKSVRIVNDSGLIDVFNLSNFKFALNGNLITISPRQKGDFY